MKKRSHRNNKARTTARERAQEVARWWAKHACIEPASVLAKRVQFELQQHARAELARARRRWAVMGLIHATKIVGKLPANSSGQDCLAAIGLAATKAMRK